MADIGWGKLADFENVGTPFYTFKDFKEVSFEEAIGENYKHLRHAAHGMIFTKLDGKLWDLYPRNATALMQVRFDGMLGFPGGLVDPGETCIHDALNRECVEEIALDLDKLSFSADHHLASHVNTESKLVTHFYVQEVTDAQFSLIEKSALEAQEWGVESFGLIRIPLFVLGDGYRGFPVFLAHKFAGNAKEQLILTLQRRNVIEQSELDKLLKASHSYLMKMNSSI